MQKRTFGQGLEVSALSLGALSVTLTSDDLAEIKAAGIKTEGGRYFGDALKRSGL